MCNKSQDSNVLTCTVPQSTGGEGKQHFENAFDGDFLSFARQLLTPQKTGFKTLAWGVKKSDFSHLSALPPNTFLVNLNSVSGVSGSSGDLLTLCIFTVTGRGGPSPGGRQRLKGLRLCDLVASAQP